MPNYENGKIYKIVCNITGDVYIGATTQKLSQRLTQHVSSSKKTLRPLKSRDLILRGDYQIVLIENYSCNSKEELERKEREHIEANICVNRYMPTRTIKEWCDANKETLSIKNKEYRNTNKEVISVKQKEYRDSHKEEIALLQKDYYNKHKESIKSKSNEYYATHKEMIRLRGKEYRIANKEAIALKKKEQYQKKKEQMKELKTIDLID